MTINPDAPAPLPWIRACGAATTCIEVALADDRAYVRDSKQEGTGAFDLIELPMVDFRSALEQIVAGTWPVLTPSLRVLPQGEGGVSFASSFSGVVLQFDESEWSAFRDGAAAGVFVG